MRVAQLSSGCVRIKPRMTLIEAVGATILFDLALFGTDNAIVKFLIRKFTEFQNSWDKPYSDPEEAEQGITYFCEKLGIQQHPWIWDRPIDKYRSLNDFFTRTYHPSFAPVIGKADIVSPACCTLRIYRDDEGLRKLLIKGCEYKLEDVGIPHWQDYYDQHVVIGYLGPSDYHRVHLPCSGKIVHLQLESASALSASVKFFEGRFNILNLNKRLVVIIEKEPQISSASARGPPLRIALVIVGGVGVNSIIYDPDMLGRNARKGEEIATFRAGGSAIAMFSNQVVSWNKRLLELTRHGAQVEVMVGESLADCQ